MATSTEQRTGTTHTEPSGWAGWIRFAGLMMIFSGVMNATYGVIALINDQWVVWGNDAAMVVDITGWGWVHLILGIVVLLAGAGSMSGNPVARVVAVIVVGVSLIVNFVALPIYPFWSIIVMAIDVLVIRAVIVHGREVRSHS